jgi:hypothetical protein
MKAIDELQKTVDRLYNKIAGSMESLDLLNMENGGL